MSSINSTSLQILTSYMDYVLTNEHVPISVFKFCKDCEIDETEFYSHFGTLQHVRKAFWDNISNRSLEVVQEDEAYAAYDAHQQLLSFYFTLFENLTLNRSYVLFMCDGMNDYSFRELKVMRSVIKPVLDGYSHAYKSFVNQLSPELGAKLNEESLWLQFYMIFKFWMKDGSPGFESTDVFIEKVVKLSADLSSAMPVDSLLDFGKFIYKEMKAHL